MGMVGGMVAAVVAVVVVAERGEVEEVAKTERKGDLEAADEGMECGLEVKG